MSSDDTRKFYVYAWYYVDTGNIFYIGKGSGNRYKITKRENNRFNEILSNHECESRILIDNLTDDEALEYECIAIDIAKEKGYQLVNKFKGGKQPPNCKGRITSDETKEKMRNSMKAFYDKHPERKEKASKEFKEFLKTEKGKEFRRKSNEAKNNDEFRKLQSIRCKKANTTPEYLARQSQIVKKMWESEEYANAHRGANNHRSQAVNQYDLNGNFIARYDTLTEASQKTGADISKICAVCKGRRKTTGGYVWEYVNDKRQTCSRENYVYNPDNYKKTSKPVLQYDLNGNLLTEYCSINAASRANSNMHISGIQANLRGRTKTAYGYIWKFK